MKVCGVGDGSMPPQRSRDLKIKDCQGSSRSDDSVTVPSLASRIRSTD